MGQNDSPLFRVFVIHTTVVMDLLYYSNKQRHMSERLSTYMSFLSKTFFHDFFISLMMSIH